MMVAVRFTINLPYGKGLPQSRAPGNNIEEDETAADEPGQRQKKSGGILYAARFIRK